jgi:UDP-glucose 4-epimerase
LYGPYGKGYPEFGFVNYFINMAHADQEITVYGPGTQRRNVLFAEDAAEALFQAAQNPKLYGEVYFATHDEHESVIDIATHIVKVFGRGSVSHVEWPEQRKRIEVDDVRISSQLFRGLTTWRPRYSFLEGLERTRAIMEQKK